MTLMHNLGVGAWSCIKRIFPPYRFSWNHTWIWTMCPWSRTWFRKYLISRPSSSYTCWREWTVWRDIWKHNNSNSIGGMMVSPLCNSSFCIHFLIRVRRMVYSCGVKIRMRNVCSHMGTQSLANPTPWRMGRKLSRHIWFIDYWKELCEEDITKRVRDTYKPLIAYWDHICSALITLGGNTRMTLTQRFWPKNCLTVVESNTMFFDNGEVHEEFAMDEHYVGLARNRPVSLFRGGAVCHEGYMVLVRAQDEDHPNQFGWWKHCLHPILFELAPTFVKLKWNIVIQTPKTIMCFASI